MKQKTQYLNYAGLLEFMHLDHNNTDLFLSHCGMQQCKPGHRFGHSPRPEYHLHFILDGCGTLRYHSEEYHLRRGQIFVIPPDETDYVYQADMKSPWYYAWAAFQGSKAERYMSLAGFDRHHIIRNANIPPEEFSTLIYDMLDASQLTIANEFSRTSSLFLLLAHLIESNTPDSRQNSYLYTGDAYVKYAVPYMQFNYNQKININDIASYVGINRSYFSYIFKQKTGISPKEFLRNCRIEKAEKLLTETTLSVSDIAGQVGYPDPFTFSKFFKNITGLSPRDYRNRKTRPASI